MSLLSPKTIVITAISGKQPVYRSMNLSDNMDEEGEPKKRRRLTHLSAEEKMLRRKLKNRVAAQTARDRKKAQMSDLEIKIAKLESENKKLQTENKLLKTNSTTLVKENEALKERLGQVASSVSLSCGRVSKSEPPRSAEGTDPGSLPRPHDALRSILPHSQPDVLLGLLEQLQEGSTGIKSQAKTSTSSPLSDHATGTATPKRSVVGASPAELESINELIKFDHIYYKVEPNTQTAAKSSPASQTNTKDQVAVCHVPSGQEVKQEVSVPMTTDSETASNVEMDIPTICIDDDSSIEGDTGLQLLEDIESLLQSEELLDFADLDPASLTSGSVEIEKENDCSKTRGQKRKHSASNSNSGSLDSLSVDDHLQDYFSDSGISDVPSPSSDMSSSLGDESWHESFSELFPDLL